MIAAPAAIAVALLVAITLPALLRRAPTHRRLRRLGRWFPAALWTAALMVMALCLATDFRTQPNVGGIAFGTLLLAPLGAAMLTLAWRDARTGERMPGVMDASATHPFGTLAPPWVRAVAVILGPLFVGCAGMMLWNRHWDAAPGVLAMTAVLGYVAVTGRVPRWLAARA